MYVSNACCVHSWRMWAIWGRCTTQDARKDVWPYLLGVFPPECTSAERVSLAIAMEHEYTAAKMGWMSKPLSESTGTLDMLKDMVKDVVRTDRDHPLFAGAGNPNLLKMMNILMTYCVVNNKHE